MELAVADELFTLGSFVTLQGGAAAAAVVPSVIDNYFYRLPKPALSTIGLTIAQLAAYGNAVVATDASVWKWGIAFLNGFVIFAAAAGASRGLFVLLPKGGDGPVQGLDDERSEGFFRNWF